MVLGAWCLWFVVVCLLYFVRGLLFVVRFYGLLLFVCCLMFVVKYLLVLVSCFLFLVC